MDIQFLKMSLEKAIEHKKEHRKKYRGMKAIDPWCRNHNYCWICRGNRLHKKKKDEEIAKIELKSYKSLQ